MEETRGLLAQSPQAILLSRVGLNLRPALRNELKTTNFCGHGSLARLLKSSDDAEMVTVLSGAKSYVYDPSRHQPLLDNGTDTGDELAVLKPELAAFIRRLYEVVGLPLLHSDTYRAIFQTLTRELATGGFSAEYELSGRVRDSCQSDGKAIARAKIGFVIKGLSFARYDFSNPSPHWIDAARAFCENTMQLCKNAGLTLSPTEQDLIIEWLVGSEGMPITSTTPILENERPQYELRASDETPPPQQSPPNI